jgi:DNA-binding XRE family transcriptional regulator
MDKNLHLSYLCRVRRLRQALRCFRPRFARILGISVQTLVRIETERRYKPDLYMIRRIRLMERIYARQLSEDRRRGRKYKCTVVWGKERKTYEKYEGDLFTKRAIGYRQSIILPDRKEDIEALGGMEVFGSASAKKSRPAYNDPDAVSGERA